MSGACDLGTPPGANTEEEDKMAQASSLFAPEDDTNGDVEMTNISHKVLYSLTIKVILGLVSEHRNGFLYHKRHQNLDSIIYCNYLLKKEVPKRQFMCFAFEQPLDHLNILMN